MNAGETFQFERYALNRSTFVPDCYLFFHMLLDGLTKELSKLERSDFKMITAFRSPTISFPLTPRAPPSRFSEIQSYLLMIQKGDFISTKDKWFPYNMYFEFTGLLRQMENEKWPFLKVCAKLLSGGWDDQDLLQKFLQKCSKLPKKSSLKELIVEKLYLGVYTVVNKGGICFALTRYLPFQKCSEKAFAEYWRAHRTIAAKASWSRFSQLGSKRLRWDIITGIFDLQICSSSL